MGGMIPRRLRVARPSVDMAALAAARRLATASAALEGRVVPDGFVRSARVEEYLRSLRHTQNVRRFRELRHGAGTRRR